MKIINQIYWDRVNETYMYGTKLSKRIDETVTFQNNLMASGEKIMRWSSRLNYQAYAGRLGLIIRPIKKFHVYQFY